MQSRWVDRDAKAAVDRFAAAGISSELAHRVYTTRLLGGDAALVLHGGGNTSVKTKMRDLAGDEVEVLCIKGTGGNMGTIEPGGMVAVRLAPLQRLRTLDDLSDDDMARVQRGHLLDPMAPSPSLELLLHAFMPHKFVDHTHANAVLSLIDQPDGAKLCEEVYGGRVGLVPYVRPGFGLAKAAATTFDKNPKVEGLILDKHGIFSFGASAKESYERMIELVSRAEERLKKNRKAVFKSAQLPQQVPPNDDVAPFIRGACSLKDAGGEGAHRRMILEYRSNDAILNFINGAELKRYGATVVITPDFTIRTKSLPLILPTPQAGKLDDFKRAAHEAVAAYIDNYKQYFARHNARSGGGKKMVDPLPRIVLVPGLGLYGLGRSAKDARIAADLAEAAVATITDAEAIGRFQSITEADMFDIEYWPIEQAKLGKEPDKPLAGQVAVVTGAAGAIGAATAKAFAAAGAEVALLDVELRCGGRAGQERSAPQRSPFICDVTNDTVARRVRPGRQRLRRRRHRRLQRRRGLAGPHRRGRRRDLAQKLRAQFLRPPARRAGRREDHAGAGHRRLPAVQRVEAGGESGPELRALRPAQGRDTVPGAAIRGRLRRRRHPRQRGERRPHPLGAAHRRLHQGARRRRAASPRRTT